MQNPPPVQTTKSSTGLDENVAALLAYVVTWVSGLVFFLIEKESRLVRFHAMQAILLGAAGAIGAIVLWLVWVVIAIILAQVSEVLASLVSLVIGLLIFVFYIAILVAWIMGMVKAYGRQYFKLPIIGNFAEKFSMK